MKEEGIYDSHKSTVEAPKDQKRIDLREDFTKKRGYWHEFWEDFLRLDPEFFEAYLDFSTVPWVKNTKGDGSGGGVLSPRVSETKSHSCSLLIFFLLEGFSRAWKTRLASMNLMLTCFPPTG